MTRRSARVSAALLCAGLAAPPGRAAEAGADPRIEQLERRVEELEHAAERSRAEEEDADSEARGDAFEAQAAEWTRRVRLSGSADTGYFNGENDSIFQDGAFQVWDARFFVDAELGEDIRLGELTAVRNAGFTFEWNLVRIGKLKNDVGELFVEFQGLGGSDAANLQVGRFQIPVGEAYLLYSKGTWRNPFVSNPVGGPWWWDDGVKVYGLFDGGRFGYIASVTNGDSNFNVDLNGDKQTTLKLFADPLPWLHLSISGLRSGEIGSRSTAASGSLWLGEMWARAFGSGTAVPNFVNGVAVVDGPNRLRDSYFGGADAILRRPGWGQLWLGSGIFRIDSHGPGIYDRTLYTWIAEGVLEGGLAHFALAPFYLGLRADGIGTYDRGRGYLLDMRFASTLGYNMESITAVSAVLGWRMNRWLTLRSEYTHAKFDLVRGVPASLREASDDVDVFAVEVGAHF